MQAGDESLSTSTSLLDRLRHNDQQAWTRLCQLYSPSIYRWARQFGLQEDDAADVAQEVFSAVIGSIARYSHRDPGCTFRGWLWTITRNKVNDHFRAAAKLALVPDSIQSAQQVPEAAESDFHDESAKSELAHRAMELLKTDFETSTWTAFLRTAVDGQPAARVADELGISIGAVYVARSRVLHRLRTELDGLL